MNNEQEHVATRGTDHDLMLLQRIEEVLDSEVRSDLEADGGAIEIIGIESGGILLVRMLGTCAGCSGVNMPLIMEIEGVLKARIPEIRLLEVAV